MSPYDSGPMMLIFAIISLASPFSQHLLSSDASACLEWKEGTARVRKRFLNSGQARRLPVNGGNSALFILMSDCEAAIGG